MFRINKMHCFEIRIIFAAISWTMCDSLDKNGPHVCPDAVQVRDRDVQRLKFRIRLICCPDYYLDNDRCIECPAGTFGKDCALSCFPGFYGSLCKSMCNCSGHKKCDPVYGCICDDGWMGNDCKNQCPAGTFGKDCALGCLPGFYGSQCKTICNCSHHKQCDPIHGCICDDGWMGIDCSNHCLFGLFGFNCSRNCQCKSKYGCEPTTGDCFCPPGWTGQHCTQACPFDSFGIHCKMKCQCVHHEGCDPVTGKCFCRLGWHGHECKLACPVGWFGTNCSEKCQCLHDEGCIPATGECICPPGWYGFNCTNNNKKPSKDVSGQSNTQMIIIALISVIGSLLLIVFVIELTCIKRLKCRQQRNITNNTDMPQHHEFHPYDEIPLDHIFPEILIAESNNSRIDERLELSPVIVHRPEENFSETNNIVFQVRHTTEDGTYLNPYSILQPYESRRIYEKLKRIYRCYSWENICTKPMSKRRHPRRNTT